jgi:hypothetical protein
VEGRTVIWLQTWQPAIGSFLGLVTIFIAASVGFRFNRKRDEYLRQEEMRSIAAALYAEVITLRIHASKMANFVAKRFLNHGLGRRDEKFDSFFFEMIPMPPAPIYAGLSSQIGKLPAEVLLGIVQFHAAYEDARYWLPRLEENADRGFSYSVLSVLRPALKAVEGVQATLEAIETLANISPQADAPDLNSAKEVAAWEEEMWAKSREQEQPS